jgi:hypothetical protein
MFGQLAPQFGANRGFMSFLQSWRSRAAARLALAAGAFLIAASPALADRISTPIAQFTGLDKITGRIISFDVYIGETVQFGSLQITPRVCYKRTPEEPPQTDAFVEVKEVTNGANGRSLRTIFSSWMFAESPAMNAVDHPVYDVWLTDCKTSSDVPPPADR